MHFGRQTLIHCTTREVPSLCIFLKDCFCIGCCHLFFPSFLCCWTAAHRLPGPSFSLLKSLLFPPFSWTCFSKVITSHAIRGFIWVLYCFCCFKEFLFFPSEAPFFLPWLLHCFYFSHTFSCLGFSTFQSCPLGKLVFSYLLNLSSFFKPVLLFLLWWNFPPSLDFSC